MKIQLFDNSIEKFISSLEKTATARVLRTIDLLETFGPRLGMPHSKKVGDRLFELRTTGRQETRIFYTFYRDCIVLLYGFVKKSQKIPRKELRIAMQRLRALD